MTKLSPKLLLLLSLTILTDCAGGQSSSSGACFISYPFRNDVADARVMDKWARSCALCHISGEAGAPVVGDEQEWRRRLAKGERSVLENTLHGYNSMPPLGYCMSCEVDDFRAMIAYMAGTNP